MKRCRESIHTNVKLKVTDEGVNGIVEDREFHEGNNRHKRKIYEKLNESMVQTKLHYENAI